MILVIKKPECIDIIYVTQVQSQQAIILFCLSRIIEYWSESTLYLINKKLVCHHGKGCPEGQSFFVHGSVNSFSVTSNSYAWLATVVYIYKFPSVKPVICVFLSKWLTQ